MARTNFRTADVAERIRRGVRRGILEATEGVRSEALRLVLDTPKTGRYYRRRGVVHRASAPGEPPASDTGTLVGRIRTEYDQDGMRGRVVASTAYARYLEFGTKRMVARPFMRPALANMRPAIVEALVRSVRAALRERTP